MTYILAIDDDEYWRNRMQSELRSLGHELLVAKDPRAAIELFRDHEKAIVLVVSDNQMRISDLTRRDAGIDLLHEIRLSASMDTNVPFILFTSEATAAQRQRVCEHKGEILVKDRSIEGELRTRAKALLNLP